MQQLAQVSRRFSTLLAHPAEEPKLWGTLTVKKEGVVDVSVLMKMIPWLTARAAGEHDQP